MIPKNFNEIGFNDLNLLIGNVKEGKTIEFKIELPHEGDSQKIPFWAEISAFANTVGGDLIFGVEEVDGIAVNIPGIKIDNLDKEILRLENSIRNGIEPRIPDILSKSIKLPSNNHVIFIRIGRSWHAPHRVSYKDHSKFYGRNSAGKYPLDVSELRTAFNLSEMIPERIRRFREDRVTQIIADHNLPVNLVNGSRIALHVIPLSAFTTINTFIIKPRSEHSQFFRPLGASGWNNKLNVDGIVTHDSIGENIRTYAQIFRSGIIETVYTLQVRDGDLSLPSEWYEREIINSCGTYSNSLRKFGIQPPIYFFLSFINFKGCKLGYSHFNGRRIDREIILFPEVVYEDFSQHHHAKFRPIFDMVWNAFGFEASLNYKEDGSWGR